MCQAGLLPPHPDSRLSLEVPASLCPWPTLPKSPTPQAGLGLSHFVHLRRLEELSRVRPAPGSLSPVSPMSPAASTQGKDWMVWKASLLPLLLLPLLIPGKEEGSSMGWKGECAIGTMGQWDMEQMLYDCWWSWSWCGPDLQPSLQVHGHYQRLSIFIEWQGRHFQ